MDERNRLFFRIITIKLFYTALSNLTVQSNVNITWISLYIFKHKHKSNVKGAIFELRSSHLFGNQPYKEVLEFICQITLVFYPSLAFSRILFTFFRRVLCRTSHNLNCNKLAIIKNKNLTKILEVVKFSSI